MELKELYRRLSYGELSNLALAGEGVGSIIESARPRIINYANEALLRLHSRFVLRQNVLIIKQIEHLTYYYMLGRFALSALTDPPCENTPHLYIQDSTEEPFLDDVIKILEVRDTRDCVLPLNDADDPKSLFTPQPNLLQIPDPKPDEYLAVGYQARHPKIEYLDHCVEIDLPYTLEGALTAYIAYKVFDHMNGQDNTLKAQGHLANYEMICNEVTEHDLVSQTQNNSTPTKFERRGFS
jgi:hypothetical protein